MSRNRPHADDAPSGTCRSCGASCTGVVVDMGYGETDYAGAVSEHVDYQWRCPWCNGEIDQDRRER